MKKILTFFFKLVKYKITLLNQMKKKWKANLQENYWITCIEYWVTSISKPLKYTRYFIEKILPKYKNDR